MDADRMVASVAVLSDIHGVLPALEAVLAEPDVAAAERVVLTGDIAAGPQPVEVLDRLADLGERAIWVRGNADRALVELARGDGLDVRGSIAEWAAAQLRSDQVALLDTLPHPVTLRVNGFGDVLFCHATPRDDDEMVLVDSPMDRWAEVLATVPDAVSTVVCGHTHMQFVRLAHGRQIVNAGSVGMPYGRPGAHWALLADGVVSLRRTMFDLDEACAAVTGGSTFPEAGEWADFHIRARATDAYALEKLRSL
ncbi:metallophosphoesterase family protein [Saccharopolyspora sp. NPDC050642]|uniref:metallophosphoesterase family protein n=1 Tax=Saccharopolyspora sp. NPDC050642 TaxID=3157099 RepID=UPI0033EC8B3D